jgi:gliding motility-associated-like protein
MLKIRFILASLLVGLSVCSHAIFLPVDLNCSRVETNGNATIEWIPKYGSLDFARYEVYYSQLPTSGFTLIDQIPDITTTSYLHTQAYANDQSAYYYIKTIAGGGGFAISDTIGIISTSHSVEDESIVHLSWTSPKTPLPSGYGYYNIYVKIGNGTWNLLDSTQATEYPDTTFVCEDRYYKIVLSNGGCDCISTVEQVDHDIMQPYSPLYDSVSVDVNGNISFGWTHNITPDVQGYVIFKFEGGIWDTLAVVNGATTSFYTDYSLDPSTSPRKFCIAAFDMCGNMSGDMGIPQAQQTILLQQPQFDPCADSVVLNWSAYTNFMGGLSGYRVYYKENDDVFLPLSLVPPGTTSYIHKGLEDNVKYSYFIRAIGADGSRSSSSVIRSLHVRKPAHPSYEYLKYVTVVDNKYIKIQLLPDSLVPVTGYDVMRSESENGPFKLLRNLDISYAGYAFADSTAEVSKKSYFYKILVYDSCGNVSLESNTMNSIHLRNAGAGLLSWNKFEGFETGVEGYDIYRIKEGITEKIGATDPGVTEYSDPNLTPDQSASYYVEAIEAAGNQYGIKEKSVSNQITLDAEFRLNLPNAFTPYLDNNNVFRPKAISFDASEYYFAIFSRFGMKIFETTDYSDGWDGRSKGDPVNSGAYVYYIRMLTLDGRYVEQRGLVVVLN